MATSEDKIFIFTVHKNVLFKNSRLTFSPKRVECRILVRNYAKRQSSVIELLMSLITLM